MHKRAQAGRDDETVAQRIDWIDDHLHLLVGMRCVASRPAAQEIQCGVVCYAEQPLFGLLDGSRAWQGGRRLQQRVLQYVFAVDDGSRHACAVTMQARSQFADDSGKRGRVERVGHPSSDVMPLPTLNPYAVPFA